MKTSSPVTSSHWMRAGVLHAIGAYRLVVSPWLPGRCRFHPSCSQYATEAVERHGVARGGALALARIGRCHPWHAGGHDPVPPVVPPAAS